MKILHIITALKVGGAEIALLRLASEQKKRLNEVTVISLLAGGELENKFKCIGVDVVVLGLSRLNFISKLFFLVRHIKQNNYFVMHTWMYHANIIAGICALLAGYKNIVWSFHATGVPRGLLNKTFWLIPISAILSYLIPKAIICCANSCMKYHKKFGFSSNMVVINNGFNFNHAVRSKDANSSIRQSLGIHTSETVIGTVGRNDQLKDYKTFVNTLACLKKKGHRFKVIMVGDGLDNNNIKLIKHIKKNGLLEEFYLVGKKENVLDYYSSFDIFFLSSKREALPNVIVEAISMKVACVSTNVGDVSELISDKRLLGRVSDPNSLAKCLSFLASLTRRKRLVITRNARNQLIKKLNISAVTDEITKIYN